MWCHRPSPKILDYKEGNKDNKGKANQIIWSARQTNKCRVTMYSIYNTNRKSERERCIKLYKWLAVKCTCCIRLINQVQKVKVPWEQLCLG